MTNHALVGEALERILAGNQRWAAGESVYPNQTPDRRRELAAGQPPFAAILGCADSRVPPEIIFDQGLGDLFIVRVAGNVLDNISLGSLEFAVQHFDIPLIIVLGHSGCGAVLAAMDDHEIQGQIATLVKAVHPALELAKEQPGGTLDRAVRSNVALVVRQLRAAAPILAPLVEAENLKIRGAYYDQASGLVELLE